ncbi:MAG: ribonuclease III domain-containing protein [Leptolyngbyaceae cyanobacterium bins.302]|nr:ribonuclease III domain-containing protein [Leptolyngbyaceae cyanobacterium bins.302]
MPTDTDTPIDPGGFSQVALNGQLFPAINLPLLSAAQIQQLSPAALAYIGDAVYELFIRHYYLLPPQRIQAYHQQVVAQVRAEAQARHLQTLIPQLTAIETAWLKRGRNAVTSRPRRVDADIYQQATSLETLVGYLYLTNPQRLMELLSSLDFALIASN